MANSLYCRSCNSPLVLYYLIPFQYNKHDLHHSLCFSLDHRSSHISLALSPLRGSVVIVIVSQDIFRTKFRCQIRKIQFYVNHKIEDQGVLFFISSPWYFLSGKLQTRKRTARGVLEEWGSFDLFTLETKISKRNLS